MNEYEAIGLMSGTSCDGLDIAACRFYSHHDNWKYELIASETLPYSDKMRSMLINCVNLSALEIAQLDIELGTFFGEKAKQFMEKHKLDPFVISSHGHTVFHQPDKKITLQIGNGLEINRITKSTVVNNFRQLDVLNGGQGAPLVPLGEKYLFNEYAFCLNTGGFANISFETNANRNAFDICPVNIVMNQIVSKIGLEYDEGGKLASNGSLLPELLKELNDLKYYKSDFPKSLGKEWVDENILPLITNPENSTEDLLHTYCHHIGIQISDSIFKHASNVKGDKILITGGGARNTFLMECIKKYLHTGIEMVIPKDNILDFKEAIIFAFLGLLRMLNKTNILKSVTGSSMDSSSGIIISNSSK